MLTRPNTALSPHIFLRFDAVPDLAMQTAQMHAVVVRLLHQDDMSTTNLQEEMISTLDVEFLSHGSGNGDLMFAIHFDPERHGTPPIRILQTV